jgi:hypothetical protein
VSDGPPGAFDQAQTDEIYGVKSLLDFAHGVLRQRSVLGPSGHTLKR